MLARSLRLAPRLAKAAVPRQAIAPVPSVRRLCDGIHDDFKPKKMRDYATDAGDVHTQISKDVAAHKVVVYMKGTKDAPMCGFSNAVVQVMKAEGADFQAYNVLADPDLREGIKSYNNWPTIPQVAAGRLVLHTPRTRACKRHLAPSAGICQRRVHRWL